MVDKEDYQVILYGINLLSLIVFSPLWVPVWALGVIAKKFGVKP